MAYQRPNQGGGGYRRGGNNQSGGGGRREQASSAGNGGGMPDKKAGNKPAFRLALCEIVDGKTRTVKGDDGRTVYVGAAWANKFDGFNVKIEEDIPAGAVVRMYPVDGDGPGQKQ